MLQQHLHKRKGNSIVENLMATTHIVASRHVELSEKVDCNSDQKHTPSADSTSITEAIDLTKTDEKVSTLVFCTMF